MYFCCYECSQNFCHYSKASLSNDNNLPYCNFQTSVLILVVRGKEKHFYRLLLLYIQSCKFSFRVLLLSFWAEVSLSQEVRKISENLTKEFLKFSKCFEENSSMIFQENKVILKIVHVYTISQLIQLNVCPFMLHEYQPTVVEDFLAEYPDQPHLFLLALHLFGCVHIKLL